jgi:hypothetical protein
VLTIKLPIREKLPKQIQVHVQGWLRLAAARGGRITGPPRAAFPACIGSLAWYTVKGCE